MANPLHNLDDAMAELEKKSIPTSQGTFVRMDDVKKIMAERLASDAIEEEAKPKPKDMNQAKQMVLKDKELMANFPPKSPNAGRSLPAVEPQPSSRT